MKFMFVCMLMLLSASAFANVSKSLSASIEAAKLANPKLFNSVSSRLITIQRSCLQVTNQSQNIQMNLVQNELVNALDYELSRIDKSIPTDSGCLSKFMNLSLAAYAKNEGMSYLKSVKSDVISGNFQGCSDKLLALLGEVSDEN